MNDAWDLQKNLYQVKLKHGHSKLGQLWVKLKLKPNKFELKLGLAHLYLFFWAFVHVLILRFPNT